MPRSMRSGRAWSWTASKVVMKSNGSDPSRVATSLCSNRALGSPHWLVLAANCVLLSAYLFGCHSLRHVVGGCVDELSRSPMGSGAYSCVSCLNRKHMMWAWCSLFTVGFADLYVRLCSMGVWSDFRIW